MQGHYPAQFERDMACTESEWLRWLPAAVGAVPCQVLAGNGGQGNATVTCPQGHLLLRWLPLPPRVIGLLRMPRLQVQFVFDGVPDEERQRFMRRFDLHTQRGGG